MSIIVLFIFLVASSCSSMFCTAQVHSSAPKPEAQLASWASTRSTLPMLVVVFIISLFIAAIYGLYIRYCYLEDQFLLPQTTRDVARGIDPRVLATCPVVSYSALLKLTGLGIKTAPRNAAFQCAVCLAEFEDSGDDALLRLLPRCGHVFHRSCIDAWLAAHVTCPVCRGEVSVETEGDTRARHVLLRSHSTGHSLESFTPRLPQEMMMKKLLEESERGSVMKTGMKRSASYDVVLRSVEGGEGSNSSNSDSNVKRNNYNNRWVLSITNPFVSRGSGIPRFWNTSVREEKECRGRTFHCEV